MRRRLAIAAAVTALVLAAMVTRVVWEGRAALRDGDDAAARGDLDRAVARWEAAARWYVPYAPHVGAARARLADAGAQRELARAAAATRPAPSPAWVVVSLAGLALWLGGCVHFARRGLDAQDRLVRRATAAAGGMVVVGMLVWVLGLYNP